MTSGTEFFHPHLAIKKHHKKKYLTHPRWSSPEIGETQKPQNPTTATGNPQFKAKNHWTGENWGWAAALEDDEEKAATEVDVSEVGSVGPPPPDIRVIRELVVEVTHVAGS